MMVEQGQEEQDLQQQQKDDDADNAKILSADQACELTRGYLFEKQSRKDRD